MSESTRCGYVAIVGRPNVGKSTLLNKILQQKISITSRKPQTTRQRILGINTQNNVQAIYVDTPGLHQQAKRAINRYMNRAAIASIYDVDVVVFMVEAMVWKADDQWILDRLAKHTAPVILVVNKIDTVKNKKELLPFLKELSEKFTFAKVIPIAAEQGTNVEQLEQVIAGYLPQAAFIFPEDQVTDRSQRFLAAEIIREKLLRFLGQEVPYSLTVEIEQFEQKQAILHIAAVIWVEKEGQKAIVIGASGAKLKQIGTQARLDMEKLFESKVFLKLWVKVKENWSDDERALKNLGYE